jgi:cytochrome c biogenesis protein CcmG, thiol:disulfide interchange protein DsbE
MWRRILPIAIFVVLLAILGYGLTRNPSLVSSPLIGKPVPDFSLPLLHEQDSTIGNYDLRGSPYLLNVWASWCAACRVEHPLLMQVAEQRMLPVYGVNYRDTREDALAWLERHGNPYEAVIFDQRGEFGLDLGVYGAPETFLVDRNNVIVYKHIGPITEQVWADEFHSRIVELLISKP